MNNINEKKKLKVLDVCKKCGCTKKDGFISLPGSITSYYYCPNCSPIKKVEEVETISK